MSEGLSDLISADEHGTKLELMFAPEGQWVLKIIPSPVEFEAARQLGAYDKFDANQSRVIASGTIGVDRIVTFPTTIRGTSVNFLSTKYRQLHSIAFEGFGFGEVEDIGSLIGAFEVLPQGFNRNPFYGLGIKSELQSFISTIHRSGLSKLKVVHSYGLDSDGELSVEGGCIVVPERLFDRIRRGVERIHDRALRGAADEKEVMIHNAILHVADPTAYPEKHVPYRKDAIVQVVGDFRRPVLSRRDQSAVVKVATTSVRSLAKQEAPALLKLSQAIEVVTLEKLIERMQSLMERASNESSWQKFLMENSFVLKIAFGIPVALVGGQQSVGGQRLDGSGNKISDMVVKAAATGNVALVEIKTPSTHLLDKRPYRGDLYGPSRELSGAVNQILDQRYKLQKSIANLKDNSGEWDIESYAIQGVVIAGQMPTEKAQTKSLELFRNSLKSVTIFTFDEMLKKLESLLVFLRNSDVSAES